MKKDSEQIAGLYEQCLREYCSALLSDNKTLDDLAVTIPFATLLLRNTMLYDDVSIILERTKKEFEIIYGE